MPAVKGMPHGCAWGLWDKPGQEKDQLGSLNLLTPEVVQEAFKELKTGQRCALKYLPDPIRSDPSFSDNPQSHACTPDVDIFRITEPFVMAMD